MNISEKLIRAKTDLDEVYEAGRKAEYDRFWDTFQDNGNRRNYTQAFRGLSNSSLNYGWNDITYNPKYPIVCGESGGSGIGADYLFDYNTEITDTKVDIIINTPTARNMFSRCYMLETIKKLILNNINTTWSDTFTECQILTNIDIEGYFGKSVNISRSARLTKKSITSILNALSPDVTGQTLTLRELAVNKAFETSDGAEDGITSEEWQVLVATKPNWTVELV